METTAGTDQALTERVLKAYSNIEDPRLKFHRFGTDQTFARVCQRNDGD